MANSSMIFPIFIISHTSQNFPANTRALGAEEYISLPKLLSGMLLHAICRDNLGTIHFYQDDSRDSSDVEGVRQTNDETLAESVAGFTTICKSDEEVFALWE
jgi:hypothetical protein